MTKIHLFLQNDQNNYFPKNDQNIFFHQIDQINFSKFKKSLPLAFCYRLGK